METWTAARLLNWTTEYFKTYNIDNPHSEAEILLAFSLKLKRIELYIQHERQLTAEELADFKSLILRRSRHEPLAYIAQNQPFLALDFYVNQSVLIPRPETEELAQMAMDLIKQNSYKQIVDLGTGSGAIAVSLAKYLPGVKITGIDVSPEALAVAKKNSSNHCVSDRCRFIYGNLLDTLLEPADLIVSNPPYIPTAVIDTLQPEVKDWEPRPALDGGKEGMDFIEKIICQSPEHLAENGALILEFGEAQAEKIESLSQDKYTDVRIKKDLAGRERFFIGTKK